MICDTKTEATQPLYRIPLQSNFFNIKGGSKQDTDLYFKGLISAAVV